MDTHFDMKISELEDSMKLSFKNIELFYSHTIRF